jgi:RNA polymerase sigma-70 factor (ECF subfamily)
VRSGPPQAQARSFTGEALDWRYAYERFGPELSAFVYRLTANEEVAQDLVQDTFVRAIRRQGTLADQGALRAWLYRIAANIVIDWRRRRALLSFVPFLGSEQAPERSSDTPALVRQALRSIPAAQAVALVLSYHEGFSRSEVATMLGVPEETVKTRIARGRKSFEASYLRLERGLAR